MPKIVALRGYLASGKSTALNNLKAHPKFKNWIVIDFEAIRMMFNNNKKTMVEYADTCFYTILQILMKTKKNILTQETSEELLKKNLGLHIKKHNYNIKTITLIVSPETSYKRAAERRRAKGNNKPRPMKQILEGYKQRTEALKDEKNLIQADDLTPDQVVKEILKIL